MNNGKQGVQSVSLLMIRNDMNELPCFDPPGGFGFRAYRLGDAETWARIEASAGEFTSVSRALEHFYREFGAVEHELTERCFFLQNHEGTAIGTAMAWYGTQLAGIAAGRLHWVGILRPYQGRGLGRPLVSRALNLLSAFHDRAYLVTHPSRLAAIKIYLEFGFRPHIGDKTQERAWQLVSKRLGGAVDDGGYRWK